LRCGPGQGNDVRAGAGAFDARAESHDAPGRPAHQQANYHGTSGATGLSPRRAAWRARRSAPSRDAPMSSVAARLSCANPCTSARSCPTAPAAFPYMPTIVPRDNACSFRGTIQPLLAIATHKTTSNNQSFPFRRPPCSIDPTMWLRRPRRTSRPLGKPVTAASSAGWREAQRDGFLHGSESTSGFSRESVRRIVSTSCRSAHWAQKGKPGSSGQQVVTRRNSPRPDGEIRETRVVHQRSHRHLSSHSSIPVTGPPARNEAGREPRHGAERKDRPPHRSRPRYGGRRSPSPRDGGVSAPPSAP
jgi:hypothetical protein